MKSQQSLENFSVRSKKKIPYNSSFDGDNFFRCLETSKKNTSR